MPEEDLITLKIKSGEHSTKDAIAKAIYFLICLFESLEDNRIKELITKAEPTKEGMQEIVNFLLKNR